jgi:hypothetical protein
VEARVELTRKQFDELFAGRLAPAQAGRITGNTGAIDTLFAVFDKPSEQPGPHTALR